MRDIKFRVWDEEEQCFLDADSEHGEYFGAGGRAYLTNILEGSHQELIAQQYTGLKDKYGKEIYEGDLIQYNRQSSYDGINFEVKWSEDRWGWVLVSENGDFLGNEYTPEGDRYKFIEIVGNIFEKSIDSK